MEGIIACVRWMLRRFHITPQVVYRWYRKVVGRYRKKQTKYYAAFETPRPWTNVMSKEQIYPLKKAKFRDVEVYLPKHTHVMLTRIFGDYMQLPPVEKRVNHRPYYIDFGESPS
jgi:lipopolysaccharide cholinephosphotransferase